ncbi:Uncharacterized protein conserved in bacteria [Mycobacteroides abscessus subsp. abscessus]|nr:Uncharacterized protein conserved in bacteria [Mycobacteroides abscessus subsp. abscessus]
MEKIKLLFLTKDDSHYIVPASHYFLKELSRYTDLRVSHDSGNIEDILGKIDFEPDFIYLNDYLENSSPVVTGLRSLQIPFAVGLHDLHFRYPDRKKDLINEEVKHIFTYYKDKFLQWYPEFTNQMRWIPHHVNTNIYKDYGLNKEIDFLLMGATLEDFYPLRLSIINRFKGRPEFVHHPHPGYRQVNSNEHGVFVGERYAKELNRAKICLTCDSIHKYTLMKYFEITACNSLLLAPYSDEFYELGFIPGVNFVSIDENNFEEQAYYYLHAEEERKMIAYNGMKMSHAKHSTTKRVLEFLETIDEILNQETIQ